MRPDRIHTIAYHQDGLITRAQAVAAGMSDDAIAHAVGPGAAWQRVTHGVYATFTGELNDLQRLRAAVLHGGPTAMITGASACALHGLEYAIPTKRIDVLVPNQRQGSDRSFIRLNRTKRLPTPTYWLGSDDITDSLGSSRDAADPLVGITRRWRIPMAPAARAAMDAVRLRRRDLVGAHPNGLPDDVATRLMRDTRALLCEVVQRGKARAGALIAELAAAPQKWTATARRAMEDVVAGCHSAPECELRDIVLASPILPEPQWNLDLPGASGTLRPDACWPEAKLVVEVDSAQWHRYGNGVEDTERRRARYAALGWLVIPVSPNRIRSEPGKVRAEIEAAYLAGLH